MNQVKSKSGFTLMELMVYIAILGIIVIVAGQAYSNSTKMRIRTHSMLKASEVAENVEALLKEDVAQMGAKSAIDLAASNDEGDAFVLKSEVFIHPTDPAAPEDIDSSSYELSKAEFGTDLDKLALRRVRYSNAGEYLSTDEISWYAKTDKKLYRSCKTLDGDADGDDCTEDGVEVEIAEGVEEFRVLEAKPKVLVAENALFPHYPGNLTKKSFRFIPYENTSDQFMLASTDPVQGGDVVSLTNMVTNYNGGDAVVANPVKHLFFLAESVNAPADASSDWKDCKSFTFRKNATYEISFDLQDGGENLRMFRPGVDHFAVGIRDVSGAAPALVPDVPDFLVYPPAHGNGAGKRSVSFMTNGLDDGEGEKVDVAAGCVTFTVSLFSPTVSLMPISLTNVKVRLVNDGNYTFDAAYTPLTVDKKNVKAFRIEMKVTRNGEGTNAQVVIPVPSNGV